MSRRRDDTLRVDLANLSADEVDTLLPLALGGPAHAGALARICAASDGNPLFVKELLLGARASGSLVEQRDVWWLVGPLVNTPRLAELVERRVRDVDGPARSVLDLLAVWESVGLAELESVVGAAPLESLERAGLIAVRLDGRRQQVSLAHPLHGEVLRNRLPTLTRRRLLLLEHADRIERWGARRRGDLLRIATARLDAVGSADPSCSSRPLGWPVTATTSPRSSV